MTSLSFLVVTFSKSAKPSMYCSTMFISKGASLKKPTSYDELRRSPYFASHTNMFANSITTFETLYDRPASPSWMLVAVSSAGLKEPCSWQTTPLAHLPALTSCRGNRFLLFTLACQQDLRNAFSCAKKSRYVDLDYSATLLWSHLMNLYNDTDYCYCLL